MGAPHPDLAALVGGAGWLPQQLDPLLRRMLFVRLAEDELRAASFLDERLLAAPRDGAWAPLDQVVAQARASLPRRAPHAVFHIGHCGSTLLANLLDRLPGALALREPLALRTLAEMVEELPRATARWDAAEIEALFDATLALLARAERGQRVVVKATSSCNALIEPWLARHGEARAVALSIALEPYLATILKSPPARSDALRFVPARVAFLHAHLGDDAIRLARLPEPALLALGWIAERARFGAARTRFGERVLLLDFDGLLARGRDGLADAAAHFGLAHDDAALAHAWHPDVLGRYAKARDHAYGVAEREADLAESRRRHGDAIRAGLAYADALYARCPALAA